MSESMAERMKRLRDEAVFAAEKGDYATAITKLDAARIIYDTTPDQEKDGLSLQWRRIEPLIARMEQLHFRAQGHGQVRRIPVENKTSAIDSCFDGY